MALESQSFYLGEQASLLHYVLSNNRLVHPYQVIDKGHVKALIIKDAVISKRRNKP